MNSQQIEINLKNLIEAFDKETFIYELLVAYGISRTTVTRLKKGDFNLSKNEGEVLYKKKVLFKEVVSDNLLNVIDELTKNENALKHNPRFVIVTDYKTILAKDTRTGTTLDTSILEIDKHYHFFLPWAGQEKYQQKNDNHADRKASYEMAKLYDILVHENPNIYDDGGHNLNIFLSRILFCFFAEDTDIFPTEGMFTDTLAQHTKPDGNDVAAFLDRLFIKLNTETDPNAPVFLQDFPYVNGGLFNTTIKSPKFSKKAREIILDCGNLDWSEINPDIFGSMIQAVVNPAYRSGLGMHYTSVPNIMKVIEPLFLNELYTEFEKSKGNDTKLKKLIHRLSKLKIFDPACGSGNFLIIAYKELRRLEIEIIKEINGTDKTTIIDGSQSKINFANNGQIIANAPQARINFKGKQTQIWLTEIKLSQFYGIELDDFAYEMAILSLWLAEHQMNKEFIDQLDGHGKAKPILPLKEAGHITQGNATRIDWQTACPKTKDDEIYILGNPPYLGGKLLGDEQKEDTAFVFKDFKKFNNLDYIACWFYKGSKYIENILNAKCAFVSTNSICQGTQVIDLWPYILNDKIEIDFAVRSFKWTNNAKGNAGVTVIIVGLRNITNAQKLLYINNIERKVNNINAYLLESSPIYVNKKTEPISNLPEMNQGNIPLESGFLRFSSTEKNDIVNKHPETKRLFRRAIGSQELIKDIEIWCLWLKKDDLDLCNEVPPIKERIKKVYDFRKKGAQNAISCLDRSHQFCMINEANKNQIVLPIVSSENREYIPIGFVNEDYIVINSALVIYDPEPYIFGILNAKIHLLWVKTFGGKLEERLRYSVGMCWYSFPFPELTLKQKENLNLHVFGILEEREKHSEKTLAQLYDPLKMPKGLKEAHHQLDLAIERCYRLKPFDNDTERLEYLFNEYEKMTAQKDLFSPAKTKKIKIK